MYRRKMEFVKQETKTILFYLENVKCQNQKQTGEQKCQL